MTETEQILTSILDCRRIDLIINKKTLNKEQQIQYEIMKRRWLEGEPLQYIIGYCEFFGIKIFVDERVLIPRPETEILIEVALKKFKDLPQNLPLKILDLGTGSGNISISLAKKLSNCKITAIDVSKHALDIAKFNARYNNVDEKIEFVCSDMLSFLENYSESEKYDLVVSNPPYIPSDEIKLLPKNVKKEPVLSLDGGIDGMMFYREIISGAGNVMNNAGLLIMEMGFKQAEHIKKIFNRNNKYIDILLQKDYSNIDRVIVAKKVDN